MAEIKEKPSKDDVNMAEIKEGHPEVAKKVRSENSVNQFIIYVNYTPSVIEYLHATRIANVLRQTHWRPM